MLCCLKHERHNFDDLYTNWYIFSNACFRQSGSGHNIPRSDNGNEYTITISLTKYLVAIPIVVDSSTVGAVESSTLNEYIDLIYLLVKLNGMYVSNILPFVLIRPRCSAERFGKGVGYKSTKEIAKKLS